ncbi:MAG: 2,3-bisphosphoglycerate-independent phosphoglycerate mutase [Oscillospiraceae bacterium]
MAKNTLALIILDGFGISQNQYGNAIKLANTKNIDNLLKNCPNTTLGASGLNVGLPDGQMGNSEVGHTNIGAGRIVYQELTRITKSINDGDFFENEALLKAIENCKKNDTAMHLMGLVSDGGVHSHNEHLYGLLRLCKRHGLEKVFIHAITDGRDTPPKSGQNYLADLETKIKEIGVGKVATIVGRFYAMDRDNRWERVKLAYDALVFAKGSVFKNSSEVFEKSYSENITDEFILPSVIAETKRISEDDSVIFFNFRPDRAREITRTFVEKNFTGFERQKGCFPLTYVTMTCYDKTLENVSVAFSPQTLENTFGEYFSSLGLTQLRIAETEKYAHVTFFFNGGVETPYKNEDRILIPSPKVSTYDQKPEMSAYEVTEQVLEKIEQRQYDVIILNFANCDMVGHTGFMDATIKAVETVDQCLGKIVQKLTELGGACLIMADHGNADQMYDENGGAFTAHTTNPVPLILVGRNYALKDGGRLSDVAPTMLDLMNVPIPKEMTGVSLLKK